MWPSVAKIQMPAVLSAADIATSLFVDIPQMWCNSANKVFDALAAGRPVAINHEGWHAERIRQTGCGLVLDAHDIHAAAEKLVSAIRDPQWLSQAKNAARRVGQQQFHRDVLADRLESVLLAAVERRELPDLDEQASDPASRETCVPWEAREETRDPRQRRVAA